jgi:hypothetical protein
MGDDEERRDRTALDLPSGRRVEIAVDGDGETLRVRSIAGDCVLEVRLTDEGPVLSLRGAVLEIDASRSLTLRSDELRLQARRASLEVAEDLIERIGGDAERRVGGDATLAARNVALDAQPGGIALSANDDVDVTGERVRLNCDDPPMPLTWEEHQRRLAEQNKSR